MGTHSFDETSPDPRFAIDGWCNSDGSNGYMCYFGEEIDREESELFDTEMPNGNEQESFSNLTDAEEFVTRMAAILDKRSGAPLKRYYVKISYTGKTHRNLMAESQEEAERIALDDFNRSINYNGVTSRVDGVEEVKEEEAV
jgi:hypothetical protein